MLAAALDVALPWATAAAAILGAVFTALRFNRDRFEGIVGQQDTILDEWRELHEELVADRERLVVERDRLEDALTAAREEAARLRGELEATRRTQRTLENRVEELVEHMALLRRPPGGEAHAT